MSLKYYVPVSSKKVLVEPKDRSGTKKKPLSKKAKKQKRKNKR